MKYTQTSPNILNTIAIYVSTEITKLLRNMSKTGENLSSVIEEEKIEKILNDKWNSLTAEEILNNITETLDELRIFDRLIQNPNVKNSSKAEWLQMLNIILAIVKPYTLEELFEFI